ncbi:MAG: hypothetical protein ACKODX_01895 [Gemmata sp.]
MGITILLLILLVGCGGTLLAVAAALLFGALLARAAVAVANRVRGPEKPQDPFGQWDDWDSDEPGPRGLTDRGRPIPRPTLAIGVLVTLVSVAAHGATVFAGGILFETALNESKELTILMLAVFGLPLNAVLLATLFTLMLPTTFWRAALVAFFYYLIALGLAIVAAVLIVLAGSVLGL